MNERFEAARSGLRLSSGALLVIASALLTQAAHAQQGAAPASASASAAPQGDVAPEAVVMVVGTRKSVASAIDRKIRNATVSDSLVAEDINQFPDKNVGEALSRITGVQLSREFGEGSQVSIRGVEPDLNRVEINGLSVLSTSDAGRGAELRELASELISSIDVFKGSTADMTEGGVGGSVSIRTRKPLDFAKPTIAATLSAERSSSRGGVQPRASLLLADKYLGGRLGLMANLVTDKVHTQNDYARNTSWAFLRDWDMSPEKTVASLDPAVAAVTSAAGCSAATLSAAQRTACQQQWFDYNPRNARYGIWTRDHKRSSGEVTAQYKVSNELSVWASYNANIQAQSLNDRNYGTEFTAINRLATAAGGRAPVYGATGTVTTAGACGTPSATATPAGMVLTNHIVTRYTVGDCVNVAGSGGQGAFSTSARDFALDINSRYKSGGFNFKRGALEAEGLLASSNSSFSSESNNIELRQNAPGLVVSLDSQGLPHFSFPAGKTPDDAGAYTQVQLAYRPSATRNTEDQAKLDFKYRLNTPFFSRVWFGLQGRKATSEKYAGGGYLASNGADLVSTADDVNVLGANVNQTAVYDPLYTGTAQRPPDTQSFINRSFATNYINAARMTQIIEAVRGRSPGSFFAGYDGVSDLPESWMTPVYAQATQFFDVSNFNQQYLYEAPGSDGKTYPQIPVFGVSERIKSGYARIDWNTELFQRQVAGNFGVRYSGTEVRSSGLRRNSVRMANGASFVDRILGNTVASVQNKYHDVLPSANAMMWVVPDQFLVRAGWAKVMARPKIDVLSPNAICTANSGLPQFGGDGTDDCTAGNPFLKPFRARNTDLSLEYYPSADSQVSVGLFKKDIDSYIINGALVKGVDLFKDGTLWDVTQSVNGKGATTRGVEITARTALTFLPGWLRGFGVDTNYTRMTFKYAPGTERVSTLDGSLLPYPGLSKNSYNATLWYDMGPVNARLAYNYRDRYYTGGNDVAGSPVFAQKTGFLDAKLQYRIDKSWTVSLEGKNLTDQAQVTDSGDPFRVNELAWSGRRYFLSLSYKN